MPAKNPQHRSKGGTGPLGSGCIGGVHSERTLARHTLLPVNRSTEAYHVVSLRVTNLVLKDEAAGIDNDDSISGYSIRNF